MTVGTHPHTHRRETSPSSRRRKNLFVDQGKIDRAKEVFGVATETEAIDRALDLAEDFAAFQKEVAHGLDALVGQGGFVDVFHPRRDQ